MKWLYPVFAFLTVTSIAGFTIWLGIRAGHKQIEAEQTPARTRSSSRV